MVRKILLLGNEELYKVSDEIKENEVEYISTVISDLHDTLIDFKRKYGAGRAIAAPQIGVRKRLIYVYR